MTFGSTFGRVFSPTFQPRSQAAASAAAWTPNSITGCSLWFDFSDANNMFTDAGSTKVSNDGDLIYQINDKSGNGKHATQATSDARPAYKTNIQNSLSATLFDNSNDYLAFPYPLGTATDFTVFLISRFTSVSNYDAITGRNQSADWWGAWAIHLSDGGKFYAGTDVNKRISAPASPVVANNTFYSIRLKKSGTSAGNISLAVNNGTPAVNTGKTAANPLSDEMSVGFRGEPGLTPYDGYLGEYIVYNAALSAEDITLVETYLNNKWAIY